MADGLGKGWRSRSPPGPETVTTSTTDETEKGVEYEVFTIGEKTDNRTVGRGISKVIDKSKKEGRKESYLN